MPCDKKNVVELLISFGVKNKTEVEHWMSTESPTQRFSHEVLSVSNSPDLSIGYDDILQNVSREVHRDQDT